MKSVKLIITKDEPSAYSWLMEILIMNWLQMYMTFNYEENYLLMLKGYATYSVITISEKPIE